jgi:Domain of unknown function (DUF4326)
VLVLPVPLRHPEPMPQVLNIRHLPGFKEQRPIIPPGAVYIGRKNSRYGLQGSKWANRFKPTKQGDAEAHAVADAQYRRWLCDQPKLIAELPELRGRDLCCRCALLPCHGAVLLRLLETPH